MVVNDFSVKYFGKEHALHLKAAPKDKCKVTTDWEGKLYIGIALKWDYEKGTVEIYMTGYVSAAINSFQHKKPKITHDLPYPCTQPIYRKKSDYIIKRTI